VTDGGIKQMKVILDAKGLKARACGRVKLCSLSAVSEIDLINVSHKVKCLLFADIFVKRSAKIVGYIIFSVRERTCTAKAVHNGTALALDTALDLVAVDRAFSLFQFISRLEYGNARIRALFSQLVRGKYSSGARTDYNNVIFHILPPESFLHRENYFITTCAKNQVFFYSFC
jgi:hypothetical protein